MVLIFWSIVFIAMGMIGGIIYIVGLAKKDEEKIDATLLYKVISIAFGVFLFTYIISMGITLWSISMSEAMFMWFIKIVIYVVFFAYIFIEARKLLFNLKEDEIFIEDNHRFTKRLGVLFLYLALTETISGFFLDIIDVIGGGNMSFNVTTNFSIFIFVIIGLVLILVSKILKKAIEIYKENELTV